MIIVLGERLTQQDQREVKQWSFAMLDLQEELWPSHAEPGASGSSREEELYT